MPAPGTIIQDMAWCWWTRPRATRIGNDIYFGALDSHGRVVVATYDLTNRSARKVILACFEDDDHNNPAIVVEPDRPLIAFYSRHGIDDALRYRVSSQNMDISAWTEERVLQFGGPTTYAEVHPQGDTLHLFTRVDETRWGYRRSPDWASSWQQPRDFLAFDTDQQVYMASAMLSDKRTLRIAVSGHPKEWMSKPLHDVWACTVDLESGAVRLPSDQRIIANLFDGSGLPLDYPALERVYAPPANRTINLFDVGDGPLFEIGFVSKAKDDGSTTDARYHVASHRRGTWITEDIVPAGAKFGYIDAGFYVGGAAFPNHTPGGQVFLTREQHGLWHLEQWNRDAASAWTPRQLRFPSKTRLARPWAVSNPVDGFEVVALALERYGDEYFGTLSHLIAGGSTESP
jgi:BNR repeat-containing family member